MRTNARVGLIALPLFAALPMACSSGGPSVDELGSEFAKASCAKFYSCCDSQEQAELGTLLGFKNEGECTFTFTALWNTSTEPAIKAGTIKYDSGKGDACLDAVRALRCDQFGGGLDLSGAASACDGVLTGTLAVGAPCKVDDECVSGSCQIDVGQDKGVCEKVAGAGEACTTSCIDGYTCQYNAEGELVCTALKADGQPCQSSNECKSDDCQGASGGTPGMCAANTTCDGK
jgi:hypothetical protein